MKDIRLFIDLGWYTLPLNKITRDNEGKKHIEGFTPNWKEKYTAEFNEKAAPTGGVITTPSGIIAIDCDNQLTYDMFKSLDPTYTFHFVSKGKPAGGGTIIYKRPDECLDTFKLTGNGMALDFYNDGMVFLPTAANESKETWEYSKFTELPKLANPPETVMGLLRALSATKANKPTVETKKEHSISRNLRPMVDAFISTKVVEKSLFSILTPVSMRKHKEYLKKGYLHPNDVQEGEGAEYLVRVSAILGADASIDEQTYTAAINEINALWDDPYPQERLQAEIITPMIEGRSSVNGEPIWAYDEAWETTSLTYVTKLHDAIEVFFDDIRSTYYVINYTRELVKLFYKESDVHAYLDTVTVSGVSRKELKAAMPLMRTITAPAQPFGVVYKNNERAFNIFRQSTALAILNEPSLYEEEYTTPNTILDFFETLIPDKAARTYLLKFLRRKLTKFEYSPVVLFFLGAHGSGKDAFVNLLGSIIGEAYIARPTTKEFLEQYNGWVVDKYFAQLDEYGNQLNRVMDKQEALGKIKAYSGKDSIQIRQMRTDGFSLRHNLTFIMTANTNPLMLEEGDRRVALFETPNVLKNTSWAMDNGGITAAFSKMAKEINSFCYYLATEVPEISRDEYMTPTESSSKAAIIASHLPAADRIAFFIKNNLLDELWELASDFDHTHIFDSMVEGRLYLNSLFELYEDITDGKGTKRGLVRAMSSAGYNKIQTTHKGEKVYYFNIPLLKAYDLPMGAIPDTLNNEDGPDVSGILKG